MDVKKDAHFYLTHPSLEKYKWILGFLAATFDAKHKARLKGR